MTRAIPAVVSINTIRSQKIPKAADGDETGDRQLHRPGLGSGVIVSREGHVVTNYHVIKGVEGIEVTIHTGDAHRASIVGSDPLLDIAKQLEDAAVTDDYFIEHNLYPNIDFYSGIVLRAMGIPTNMFTVCFAIGRLPGWIAHWKEQHDQVGGRIARPRQLYTGTPLADYVPIDQR